MSDYTREQVIEMVKEGESLEGADLSKIDLSHANLSKANLSRSNLSSTNLNSASLIEADLSNADLRGADLIDTDLFGANLNCTKLIKADLSITNLSVADLSKADLRGANLRSADFECSTLKKTNISGANIYHIKTHEWEIDGIKCTHVYQCSDRKYWNDQEKREKYRRDFKPGEFEALYRTLPKIELIFQQGFTIQDHNVLTNIIEKINQRLKSPIEIREMKKAINTSISLSSENDEILKEAAPMINEQYQEKENKFKQLKELLCDKTRLEKQLAKLTD